LRAAEGLIRTAIADLGTPPALPASANDAGPSTAPVRRRRPRGRGGRKADVQNEMQVDVQEAPEAIIVEMDGGAAAGAAAARGADDVSMELPPDEWADDLPTVRGRPRRAGGCGSGKGKDTGKVTGGAGKDQSEARVLLVKRAADLSGRLGQRIMDYTPLSDAELHTMVGLLERELAGRGGGAADGGRGPPPGRRRR